MRLSIVNLFYPPDLSPTGHMAASLAEHRAERGDRVTVIAGTGGYVGGPTGSAAAASGDVSDTPRIVRIWTPGLGKRTTARRLGDYLSFLAGALVRLLTLPAQDAIVVLTSPPYALVTAVAHKLLHPRTRVILWSHDVYPDAVEALGTIRAGGLASRVLRGLKRALVRRVDHVVAMDAAMLERILAGYASDGSPEGTAIPSWEPISLFPADLDPDPWEGYDDPALKDRFVVLHLGNLGFGSRIQPIVDAAAALEDEDVVFLFVGGGTRFGELERDAARSGIGNVLLRGYVTRERTPSLLSGADCTLISLDDAWRGVMSPCKLNGSLAMGLPIVYSGPTGTNVDEAIERYGCGSSVRQGDLDGMIDAIRLLRKDPRLAEEQSRNARRAFEAAYSDERTLPRFDQVLEAVTRSAP
ncbi:MAG TPA: glycosyltransferase family 4 protein [Actinomycetota bacterium]|nr:glycosyltransferase family 4 protein [Actinomycetota bacterium]